MYKSKQKAKWDKASKIKLSQKAQFFVLSALIIVGILYFISQWLEPYTIIDTSAVATSDELFIFNNIKSKAKETVRISKSTEELTYNLQEYKNFIENYAFEKGKLYLSYEIISPYPAGEEDFPVIVLFNITLKSPNKRLESEFEAFWPA